METVDLTDFDFDLSEPLVHKGTILKEREMLLVLNDDIPNYKTVEAFILFGKEYLVVKRSTAIGVYIIKEK